MQTCKFKGKTREGYDLNIISVWHQNEGNWGTLILIEGKWGTLTPIQGRWGTVTTKGRKKGARLPPNTVDGSVLANNNVSIGKELL